MPARAALVLVLAALLATPAAALAQGAGDDQYSDPFGSGQEQQSEPPAPSEPAPAVPAPAEPAQAPGQPSTAPGQEQSSQLPYTGIPAGIVAAAGALLLAGGIALRRRDDRRA